MIGGRREAEQKGSAPRMIVRRRRSVVGQHQTKAIIKRERGVMETGSARNGHDGRHQPRRRFHVPTAVKLIAVIAAALAVLVGGGAWAYESPLLRVASIEVEGAGQIPQETIAEKVNLVGESMFTADLGAAQQELYKMALVSSVKVERAWPDTVKVVITERQPWGTWEQGGIQYTIDREGVVLGQGGAQKPAAVIRSSEPGSRIQGERVDYQAVDAAAEIFAKLPQVLSTTVTEVAFVSGKGVQVTTADGQTAMLGDSSSIAYKLAVWAALAKQAQAQRINYTTIDLRFGNRPVLQ